MAWSKDSTRKPKTRAGMEKKYHFRSVIAPLAKHIVQLKKKMNEKHLEAIKQTPFKLLFMALYDEKLTSTDSRKGNKNILKILRTYDNNRKVFHIGTQCLSITAEDISVIFGIPVEPKRKKSKGRTEKADSISRKTKEKDSDEPSFFDRYFRKVVRVEKKHILAALNRVVIRDTVEAVRDFSVLTCCLICCCVFFPSASGVLGKKIVISLDKQMDEIRWADRILEQLSSTLAKYNTRKSAPGGCTMALLYWLVEHVHLAPMREQTKDEIPRVVRWDIDEIGEAISKTDLSSVDIREIKPTLTLTEIEKKIIRGEIYDDSVEVLGDDDEEKDVEATNDDNEENGIEVVNDDNEENDIVASDDANEKNGVEDVDDENLPRDTELDKLREENNKLKKKLEKSKKASKLDKFREEHYKLKTKLKTAKKLYKLWEENNKLKTKLERAKQKETKYRRKFEELTRLDEATTTTSEIRVKCEEQPTMTVEKSRKRKTRSESQEEESQPREEDQQQPAATSPRRKLDEATTTTSKTRVKCED